MEYRNDPRVGESKPIWMGLKYIRDKCEDDGIKNITTRLGKIDDPSFPVNTMDMVIMVYVFHDLEKPIKFKKNIKRAVKPMQK